jgi:hypothetical protein
MMKNYARTVCLLLLGCGVFGGCAKKAAADNQAFSNAAPAIKQTWDKAVAEDKANDYVAAVTDYRSLMAQRSSLSAGQLDAVNAAALAINQRLYAAANNGDAAAKAASLKLAGMQNQR